MEHKHRAPDPRGEPAYLFLRQSRRLHRRDEHLWRRFQAPTGGVLDLLGGERLRKHLRHEEIDVTRIVTQPVMAIRLGPALLSVDDLVEPARPLSPLRVRWRERQAIPYEDRADGPLGIIPRA